jgi:hypothetical protein
VPLYNATHRLRGPAIVLETSLLARSRWDDISAQAAGDSRFARGHPPLYALMSCPSPFHTT